MLPRWLMGTCIKIDASLCQTCSEDAACTLVSGERAVISYMEPIPHSEIVVDSSLWHHSLYLNAIICFGFLLLLFRRITY